MKNLTLLMIVALTLFSGCGDSNESEAATTEVVETLNEETKVIINNAKSETILEENQVKSNVSYTHFGTTGARYQYN